MKLFYTRKTLLLTGLFLFLLANGARAQSTMPATLGRKVDQFMIRDETAASSLELLGKKAGISFSYKTDILPTGNSFSLSEEKKTVGQLLYQLFKDAYEYEEQSGYIIVRPRHSYFILSGVIVDAVSGQPVSGAQVSTLADAFSAETDARGFFELKIPLQHKVDYIVARKDFYSDGFMQVNEAADKKMLISLHVMKTVELAPVTTFNTPDGKDSKVAISPLGTKRRGTTRLAIGGLFNNNLGNARNLQFAGVVNIVRGSLYGIQIAGVHNLVKDTAKGVQIAGLINKSEGLVKGVQIAAVNHAKKLKGLQIGVINVADSSAGYSVGILNFVKSKNGYRRLSVYSTDLTNTNLSLKLGNSKLYSLLLAGANLSGGNKLYAVGWGLGHDFIFNDHLSVSVEGNYQFVDAGSWDNRLLQFRSSLNVQVIKGVLLFAGPVYYRYADNQGYRKDGYKVIIPYSGTALFERQSKSWLGWQIGVTAMDLPGRSNKRIPVKATGRWSLQTGVGPGIDPSGNPWLSVDLLLQRAFREGIAARGAVAMNKRLGSYNLDPQYNVRMGLAVLMQKRFYVAGDIGYGSNYMTIMDPVTGIHTATKWRFLWSPSFGWKLGQKFDISARYENLYNPFFLRIGYAIWSSRL